MGAIENFKDRLLQWIDYKNLSVSAFERRCGMSTGYVANLKPNANSKKLNEISSAFPDLNMEWLKTGEGHMVNPGFSIAQTGDNNVLQHGHAGHDLNQTNNSEKLFQDYIGGLKFQSKLTEKAMEQQDKAMSQTDKALEMMERLITLLEKSRE